MNWLIQDQSTQEKGRTMNGVRIQSIVLLCVILTICGCSGVPRRPGPLVEGEVRLKHIHLPASMQAGISYDARVDFEGNGEALIRKVCFRWVGESISGTSPSLYCFTQETVGGTPGVASTCPRWVTEGPYTAVSSLLCVDLPRIRFDEPGRFTVGIPESFIRPEYNRLVCYAEYLLDGVLVETNKVSGRALIER